MNNLIITFSIWMIITSIFSYYFDKSVKGVIGRYVFTFILLILSILFIFK